MGINNFYDFCNVLHDCGFTMGGSNSKGIFTVIPFGWEEQNNVDSPIRWHTGDSNTDPWEWRMRVLEECNDIAYSKVFFNTSGYITKEWYTFFYSVRRKNESFEEAYLNGTISQMAKNIYDIISERGVVAFYEIKQIGGFSKEDNSKFEKAVVELQMRMFITICGRQQKVNKYGESYGWSSTVYTTVEHFWHTRGYELEGVNPDIAYEKITNQVLKLNPNAEKKKINKFITG